MSTVEDRLAAMRERSAAATEPDKIAADRQVWAASAERALTLDERIQVGNLELARDNRTDLDDLLGAVEDVLAIVNDVLAPAQGGWADHAEFDLADDIRAAITKRLGGA